MKNIEPISIWDNGQNQKATVLNAYAVNVSLDNSATFYYSLMSQTAEGNIGNQLAQGNLTMTGEDYEAWEIDNYAWDWVAEQLNLVITGDYVAPKPIVEEVIEPVVEEVDSVISEDEVIEE